MVPAPLYRRTGPACVGGGDAELPPPMAREGTPHTHCLSLPPLQGVCSRGVRVGVTPGGAVPALRCDCALLCCAVLCCGVLRCLAAACVPPGCGVAHMVSRGVLPQAKRGGRSSVSKIRAGGKLGAGGGKPGAGAGAGDAGKCKCKHLPSIREKAVMTALAKLAVGDLAFCDVRCTCLFVVWHPCGTRVAAVWHTRACVGCM